MHVLLNKSLTCTRYSPSRCFFSAAYSFQNLAGTAQETQNEDTQENKKDGNVPLKTTEGRAKQSRETIRYHSCSGTGHKATVHCSLQVNTLTCRLCRGASNSLYSLSFAAVLFSVTIYNIDPPDQASDGTSRKLCA